MADSPARRRRLAERSVQEAVIRRRAENAAKAKMKKLKRREWERDKANHRHELMTDAKCPTVEKGGRKIEAGFWKKAVC